MTDVKPGHSCKGPEMHSAPLNMEGACALDNEVMDLVEEFMTTCLNLQEDVHDEEKDDYPERHEQSASVVLDESPCPFDEHVKQAVHYYLIDDFHKALTEFNQSDLSDMDYFDKSTTSQQLKENISIKYILLCTKYKCAKEAKDFLSLFPQIFSLHRMIDHYNNSFTPLIAPLHAILSSTVYYFMGNVEKGSEQLELEKSAGSDNWCPLVYPGFPEKIIPVSLPENFKETFDDLQSKLSLLASTKPIYNCKWRGCEWEKRQIFEQDTKVAGLFGGMVQLLCDNGCVLDFHTIKDGAAFEHRNCWDLFKKEQNKKMGVKKGFAFGPCVTPDCTGTTEMYQEFDKSNKSITQKCSQEKQKAVIKHAAVTGLKKEKNRGRSRNKSESKWAEAATKGKHQSRTVSASKGISDAPTSPQRLSHDVSPVPEEEPKREPIIPLDEPLVPLNKEDIEQEGWTQTKGKKKKKQKNKQRENNPAPIDLTIPIHIKSIPEPEDIWNDVGFSASDFDQGQSNPPVGFGFIENSYSRAAMDTTKLMQQLINSNQVKDTIKLIYGLVNDAGGLSIGDEMIQNISESTRRTGQEWAQLLELVDGSLAKLFQAQKIRKFVIIDDMIRLPEQLDDEEFRAIPEVNLGIRGQEQRPEEQAPVTRQSPVTRHKQTKETIFIREVPPASNLKTCNVEEHRNLEMRVFEQKRTHEKQMIDMEKEMQGQLIIAKKKEEQASKRIHELEREVFKAQQAKATAEHLKLQEEVAHEENVKILKMKMQNLQDGIDHEKRCNLAFKEKLGEMKQLLMVNTKLITGLESGIAQEKRKTENILADLAILSTFLRDAYSIEQVSKATEFLVNLLSMYGKGDPYRQTLTVPLATCNGNYQNTDQFSIRENSPVVGSDVNTNTPSPPTTIGNKVYASDQLPSAPGPGMHPPCPGAIPDPLPEAIPLPPSVLAPPPVRTREPALCTPLQHQGSSSPEVIAKQYTPGLNEANNCIPPKTEAKLPAASQPTYVETFRNTCIACFQKRNLPIPSTNEYQLAVKAAREQRKRSDSYSGKLITPQFTMENLAELTVDIWQGMYDAKNINPAPHTIPNRDSVTPPSTSGWTTPTPSSSHGDLGGQGDMCCIGSECLCSVCQCVLGTNNYNPEEIFKSECCQKYFHNLCYMRYVEKFKQCPEC